MATKLQLEQLDERTLPSVALPISVAPIIITPPISVPPIIIDPHPIVTPPVSVPPIIIDPIMPIDPIPPIVSHHSAHPLHGKGEANFTVSAPIPDAGISYSFTGNMNLHGLGSFTVSGSVHTIGFIMDGHATGNLVLTNSQGTISVSLEGPMQTGFSSPPTRFSYTITGGTGAYANMTGSGTLHDRFIPAPTAMGQPEQGIVDLKFT